MNFTENCERLNDTCLSSGWVTIVIFSSFALNAEIDGVNVVILDTCASAESLSYFCNSVLDIRENFVIQFICSGCYFTKVCWQYDTLWTFIDCHFLNIQQLFSKTFSGCIMLLYNAYWYSKIIFVHFAIKLMIYYMH